MPYDLTFDKRSATLLAACGALIAILLVAAGFLIGSRHTTPPPATPALNPKPPASSPTPATPKEATPAPPLKPPTEAQFTLQFGAFQDQPNAQAKVKQLKEKGVTATIFPTHDIAGRTFYAVRSGSYPNASSAATAARDLQRTTQEQIIVRPSQHF